MGRFRGLPWEATVLGSAGSHLRRVVCYALKSLGTRLEQQWPRMRAINRLQTATPWIGNFTGEYVKCATTVPLASLGHKWCPPCWVVSGQLRVFQSQCQRNSLLGALFSDITSADELVCPEKPFGQGPGFSPRCGGSRTAPALIRVTIANTSPEAGATSTARDFARMCSVKMTKERFNDLHSNSKN